MPELTQNSRQRRGSPKAAKLKTQNGQVVIILLLVLVIALAVGLSIVGRSVTEISTSSRTEDSSRAFSAAEAGIEKALQANLGQIGGISGNLPQISLGNQSSGTVSWQPNTDFANIEFVPFGKKDFAQLWLVDPVTLAPSYDSSSFSVYFGQKPTSSTDPNQPGLEVKVIYWNSAASKYDSFVQLFDSYGSRQAGSTGFDSCSSYNPSVINTNLGVNRSFYCKATVTGYPTGVNDTRYLVRMRILYSDLDHPVAVAPVGGSFPAQSSVYDSIGTANNTQRRLKVVQQRSVMPYWFDYALFCAGKCTK